MEDEYLQQLRRMMSELEDRRETLTDIEYLTTMNEYMRSYVNYQLETCMCTEFSFECYHYPRLLHDCENRNIILQHAPLLALINPDQQIPDDFRLQLEIQYEPYDRAILIKIMRYVLELSLTTGYTSDKVICAFSILHLVFKHYGLIEESSKLQEIVLKKLNEFSESEGSINILENYDFSPFGIDFNPVPIWKRNLVEKLRIT